jgi:coproporphyrinogen III oxidase-like Fe-S oxidoreductase
MDSIMPASPAIDANEESLVHRGGRLLDTRFDALASNTIDYWMLPDDPTMTESRIRHAIASAPVHENASLQIYVHVPFCAQRCRFCAFSGGNDLDFKQAERYSRLVIAQLEQLLEQTQIQGHPIRSVNIGGGSPDLVGTHIGYMLRRLRELTGCHNETEISVEFTLSTTTAEFVDQLAEYGVTKASFGVQSLNADVRHHMRQPKSFHHLEEVLRWIDGRIPVVNADLITGLPGQTLQIAQTDLRQLMQEPRINAISSYLLTPGAAPSMLAALDQKIIPSMPTFRDQAMMRMHTYGCFMREGWVRRGTNTYIDPRRIEPEVVDMIAGNECIGASHYEAFLIGAGPQSISFMPGARVENQVNIREWAAAIERGDAPYHLPKCSAVQQKDTALWVFPLRWEGLPQSLFDRMLESNALSAEQQSTLRDFEREGLIIRTEAGYGLSILGEVFMGRLVRDLKCKSGQEAVDQYVEEGRSLGRAIALGAVPDHNDSNNRQIAARIGLKDG